MTRQAIFPRAGVFIKKGEDAYASAIFKADLYIPEGDNDTPPTVEAYFVDRMMGEFPILPENLTIHKYNGRIDFEAYGASYVIREFHEEDGQWMSDYQISLPTQALEQLVIQRKETHPMIADPNTEPEETLDAIAFDDSVYVVGLLYRNRMGTWARISGFWTLLAPDESAYDDGVVFPIDPDKANDYIELYDKNYVTISDTYKYQVPPEDEEEEEEPATESPEEK